MEIQLPKTDYFFIGHHYFTMIGYLMAPTSSKTLVTKSGSNIPLQAQGWKHF